ncbi:MAG: glycosyltransferase family 2 protein [Gammaproteobacteria bacterium]|nr:glycosyltransferase family 2 protein [Gammaproteobacteria bacterium]MBU1415556.1 glycosyltransferase family 2 protein [Gammaproteobacteria bacterium]
MLSIAIPVYNFGKFLPQTLNSILDQAADYNVEVLIFDGGSTDNTRLLVDDYCRRFNNFRYVREIEKGGIDADLARSVELVDTKYCWLFSGDDLMRRGAIGGVLKALQEWQPDLLLCRHNECQFDMTVLKDWPVLSIAADRLFNLHEKHDRLAYLEAALSSEAYFSFMGGLVVNRFTWFKGKLEPVFNGSNWAHVGRLWKLTDAPFRLGYIYEALLDRRGGNDSFSSGGMLSRLDIQINGLLGIIEALYGENSIEFQHLKRVVLSEVEPHWSNAVRQDLIDTCAGKDQFEKLERMLARINC